MRNRQIDYETPYKQQLNENIRLVREDIDKPYMVKKIKNHADKFGFNFDELRNKVLTEEEYAAFFVKEPNRQSIHQTIAAKFINEIERVENFELLPAGGPNALYIYNGRIIHDNDRPADSRLKSIDFKWEIKKNDKTITIYASHKYTKDEGGSQDNQFHDVQTFMQNARELTGDTYFVAICDGFYYTKDMPKHSFSRIDFLNDTYSTPNSIALTSNDIENFINTIINR